MQRFKKFKKLRGLRELFPYFWIVEKFEIDTVNIIKTLYQIKNSIPKGRLVSNYGGYQTLANLDSLADFKDFTDSLKNFLETKLESEIQDLGMWGNINGKGDFNIVHNHTETDLDVISGVFYLKCDNNSGPIGFYHPNFFNYHFKHDPSEKDLILFPGYMPHYVFPNNSDDDRISIAFNFRFKGMGPIKGDVTSHRNTKY